MTAAINYFDMRFLVNSNLNKVDVWLKRIKSCGVVVGAIFPLFELDQTTTKQRLAVIAAFQHYASLMIRL